MGGESVEIVLKISMSYVSIGTFGVLLSIIFDHGGGGAKKAINDFKLFL